MKAIILAAGYATRLYPLTIDKPKALLPIAEKPILDYIVDEIETIDKIDELIIVSNHKFYPNFESWSKERKSRLNIIVLNDNTTDDTNKLGAIGDIEYAIEKLNIDDDILDFLRANPEIIKMGAMPPITQFYIPSRGKGKKYSLNIENSEEYNEQLREFLREAWGADL